MAKLYVEPSLADTSQIKKGIEYLERHDFSGFYDNMMRLQDLRPYMDAKKVSTHNREWYQNSVMPELKSMTAETAAKFRMLAANGGSDKDYTDAIALLDAKYASESSEAVTEDSFFDLLTDSLLNAIGGGEMEEFCRKTTFYPSFLITMMGGV